MSFSLLLFLPIFLVIPSYHGDTIKPKEKEEKNEIEAEREIISSTAEHRNGKIWDY